MGKGVADNAVGAILEIPPTALNRIDEADRKIRKLALTSAEAASKVRDHWSVIATGGLDKFIEAINNAKGKMDSLGNVNINLNVGGVQPQMNAAVNTVQGGANQISEALQKASQVGWESLNKNPKPKWLNEYIQSLGGSLNTIRDVRNAIKTLQQEQVARNIVGKSEDRRQMLSVQDYSNAIGYLKEYLKYLQETKAAKDRLVTSESNKVAQKKDQEYLNRQKESYKQILDLRKQINDQKIKVAQGEITKSSTLEKDKKDLLELQERLKVTGRAWTEYNTESRRSELSNDAALKARSAQLNMQNKTLKEQRVSQEELNKAIARGNEVTSQTQANKARLGNTQEAAIQRQLNSDYKAMLGIIKEQGELKAKVAAEGRQMNQAELDLIKTLGQRYALFYNDIKRIEGAYANMSAASAKMFAEDKSAQLARNAVQLADAQTKAAIAADKEAESQRKKTEQLRNQDAARTAKTQADAINSINTANVKRISLLEKINQLEEKQRLNKAGIGSALSASETTNLTNYRNQLAQINSQIQSMRTLYPGLVSAAERAFNTRQVDLATDSMNRFNAALNQSAQSKSTTAENELNALYAKRLSLLKEQEQINNRGLLRTANGQAQALTAAENQRLAQINTQLQANKQSIDNIAASYAGLAIKAERAFNVKNLQQNIDLQNKFNKAIDSIDTNKTKKLVDEYKRLYAENQKIQSALDKYASIPVGKASASVHASANALLAQQSQVLYQMHSLEQRNIQEITNFRIQKDMEANQRSISDFIQAEAQKTAEAKRQIQQQSNDRIQAYQKYLNTYQGSMAAYNKLGTRGGAYADTYENRASVIKNLESAIKSLDKADTDYKAKLEALTSALNKLKKAQKDVSDAMKPTKPMVSAQDAINAAKSATSLKDLQNAYKQLKEVMSTIDPKSAQWAAMNTQLGITKAQIDKIKTAMGEFRNESKRSVDLLGQLKGWVAGAFSVSAIQGFIKKMVDVRAQFELQNVALRAILQNKDEADRIFQQVQNLALQSPFTIMQLTTYTKQLAAYRIESEKLVDTTKMLADVSAGLGVDMGRLILAYGQVKAANYLRATEVRQFTEAGLNISGELATYFSELQGKMVSVGDVMDMISRRMVRFEDVEEVFKRVTTAGGLFYDMQKKQSESLYGQLRRITDAYNIMLNEIGQSNQSGISKVLVLIRSMISSWRNVVPSIKMATAAVGSYIIVGKVLPSIITYLKLTKAAWIAIVAAIDGSSSAMAKFNTIAKANPYGLIASALAIVITYLWEVYNAQSALNEEMERMQTESISDMYTLIFRYRELADTVASVTKPYKERKEALEELNRTYKDILPQELLEIENIQKMRGAYDEVTEAIRAYSLEKLRQKQNEAANNAIISAVETTKKELMDVAYGFAKLNEKIKNVPESQIKGTINAIFTAIESEIISGTLDVKDAQQEFYKRFAEFYDLDKVIAPRVTEYRNFYWDILTAGGDALISAFTGQTKKVSESLDRVKKDLDNFWAFNPLGDFNYTKDVFANLIKETDNVADQYGDAMARMGVYSSEAQRKMAEEADSEIKSFKEREKAISALEAAMSEYHKLQQQGALYSESGEMTQMGESAYRELEKALMVINQYQDGLHGTKFLIKDITDSLSDNISMQEKFGLVATTVLGDAAKSMSDFAEKTSNTYLKGVVENLQKSIEAMAGNNVQNKFNMVAKSISGIYNVGLDTFNGFKVTAETSFQDIAKQADDAYKLFEDNLKKYKTALEEAKKMPLIIDKEAYAESISGLTKEQVDMAEAILAAFRAMSSAFGGFQKSGGGKGKDTVAETFKNRLKAVQDFYKQYNTLQKNFSDTASIEKAKDAFSKLFDTLGLDMNEVIGRGMSESGLASNIDAMLAEVKKKKPEIAAGFEKALADVKVKIDVDIQKDAVEKLKQDMQTVANNFELSETFRKLGVSTDMVFMLGGKPTTLEDYRKALEDNYKQTYKIEQKYGEEGAKAYDELMKQIEDKEKKSLEERAKNYAKYLKKMYSDRAKLMIDSYSLMRQMEVDFQKNIEQLQAEMNAPDTSSARKKELADMIQMLNRQRSEIARGIKNELDQGLAKADWESFKGSDIFTQMYQDVSTLSKQGIDALITRLEEMREKLQSVSNIDPKAVREVTQYIEKLKNAKTEFAPYQQFKEAIAAAQELKKEYGSLENAQLALVEKNDMVLQDEQRVADLETIIALKEKEGKLSLDDERLTESQRALYKDNEKMLQGALDMARQRLAADKQTANALSDQVDKAGQIKSAYEKNVDELNKWKQTITKLTNSVFDLMEAFGLDIDDEWKQLTDSIIEAIFQAVMLQMQFKALEVAAKAMGVAMNSALGVIGWIAMALQAVAQLLMSIFAAKDKRLQKQIETLEEEVEGLQRAFDKLEDSINNAFKALELQSDSKKAIENLERQKQAIQEMIRLEEAKKKTDKDKIKEWKQDIEDIEDTMESLKATITEQWGGFGSDSNMSSAIDSFSDAWLSAFKETGDGLEALEEQWDEYIDNLIKRQIALRYVGPKLEQFMKLMDQYVSEGSDQGEFLSRQELDKLKQLKGSLLGNLNEELKDVMDYLGYGGGDGELLLSDLQKGIQNITEPQAAAIEAYLNSMRFAVYRQVEQLDMMLSVISAQYGTTESPMVTELKGIRAILGEIHSTIQSVITPSRGSGASVRITG